MPKSYKKLQKLLTFDNLMKGLDQQFKEIADHRRNNTTYTLVDVLKSGFAMFSLKSPSLLSFQEQTRIERRNLKQIYRIEKIPADTQMRVVLDGVEPDPIRAIFAVIFERLSAARVVKEYEYWKRHLLVSIDGVEHFNSTRISLFELHPEKTAQRNHQLSACGFSGGHRSSSAERSLADRFRADCLSGRSG